MINFYLNAGFFFNKKASLVSLIFGFGIALALVIVA